MGVLLYAVWASLMFSSLFMGMFVYLEIKGWLRKRRGASTDVPNESNTQIWTFNRQTGRFEPYDN